LLTELTRWVVNSIIIYNPLGKRIDELEKSLGDVMKDIEGAGEEVGASKKFF